MTKFVFLRLIIHDEIFGIGEVELIRSLNLCLPQVAHEISIQQCLTFIDFILKAWQSLHGAFRQGCFAHARS